MFFIHSVKLNGLVPPIENMTDWIKFWAQWQYDVQELLVNDFKLLEKTGDCPVQRLEHSDKHILIKNK